MPFTPAHAAAALPFRRLPLIPSALVVGTMAPDFEYFLRLSAGGGFGHTALGAVVLTWPLALAVLWIFHFCVKDAVVSLSPEGFQRRLTPYLGTFRFGGAARFSWIAVSVLLGIATHIVWDGFTHPTTWLAHHWRFLGEYVPLPIAARVPYYKLFQHGSSVIGLAILAAWLTRWYRATAPSGEPILHPLSTRQKIAIVSIGCSVAAFDAMMRIAAEIEFRTRYLSLSKVVGHAVVTVIAVCWWELVAYGLFRLSKVRRSQQFDL